MPSVYRIERSNDGVTGWATVADNVSGLSTVLSGQGVNTVKYYRVYRKVSDYEVARSNILRVVLLSVPVLTAIGGAGKDRISLTWNNVSASRYNVYRYDDRSLQWIKIGTTVTTGWNDHAISLGITYWYYVVGVTTEGYETLPSNLASAIITNGGIFSMPLSRATQYQGIQFGIESTPGTQVPATRRLINMELIQTPQIPVKTVRYQGFKGAGGTQKGQRHTEAKFNGVMDYSLLPYLASLAWGSGGPVTANGGTTWRWNPNSIDPITPLSATIEQGSSVGAEKFGYATLMDLAFKWSKEDASIEGTMFGQNQIRSATMTTNLKLTVSANAASGATSLSVTVTKADGTAATGTVPAGTYVLDSPFVNPLGTGAYVSFTVTAPGTITAGAATLTVSALASAINQGAVAFSIREVIATPIDPEELAVFVSTDGTNYTLLTDVIDGAVNLNGLFKPSFHVNDANASFDDIVEVMPNFTATLTIEEGTEANTFMSYLDNGQKIWLGLRALGSTINASPLVRHEFRLNIPMFVTKPDPGDKNDVYGNTFTFEHAHDMAFGMFDLRIVNRVPNL